MAWSILSRLQGILDALTELVQLGREINGNLKKILVQVSPEPAVGFSIVYEMSNKGDRMAAVKASIDFQMLDSGGATATLTPMDAVGNPTAMPDGAAVPVWTSSDPAVAVAASADGLSATLTPSGVLANGVVVSASSLLADGATTISGSGDPIDVVAGPASSFKIVEQ